MRTPPTVLLFTFLCDRIYAQDWFLFNSSRALFFPCSSDSVLDVKQEAGVIMNIVFESLYRVVLPFVFLYLDFSPLSFAVTAAGLLDLPTISGHFIDASTHSDVCNASSSLHISLCIHKRNLLSGKLQLK